MTGAQARGNGSAASSNGDAPFDLQAEAAKAATEAGDAPFVFTYPSGPNGTRYSLPPSSAWSPRAIDALAAGELGRALAILLGQDAYDAMLDDGLNLGEINMLLDKAGAAEGIEALPNSPSRQHKRAATRT